MRPRQLPLPERLLAARFLDGDAGEFVVGDLLERYESDRDGGRSAIRARARLFAQTVASCRAWRRYGVVDRLRGDDPERTKGDGMMGLWTDIRLAVRALSRRPGFSMGVALTLGLGVGATTSIFSVVDAVILRPLAFDTPNRIVAVGATFPVREWADEDAGLQHLAGINLLNLLDYADRARSVSAVGGAESRTMLFPDLGGGPELVAAASASPDFFQILGVAPALGRMFVPGEASVAAEPVVILSWGAWQRRFGGEPDIVGRPLSTVDNSGTVIGVLPRDFEPPEPFFANAPEIWMPLQPDHVRYERRDGRSLLAVARLSPGVGIDDARDEARGIAGELAREHEGNIYPDGSHIGIGVNSLHAQTVGTAGKTLDIWVGAAALLLILSTLNAASLLLVRSLDRSRELAVRSALGAGRGPLLRLLLIESTVLSAVGALLGLAIAFASVDLFVRFAPPQLPRVDGVVVNGRVLGVAVVLSLAAGLLSGLLPALRQSARGPWTRLRTGGRSVAQPGGRARAILVAGQLSIAMLLLSGAGLLGNSFLRIMAVEPGFEPDGLITMNISLKRPGAPEGEETWQAWDAALAELRTVPGLESVSGTTNPPFQSPFWAPRVLLPGDPPEHRRDGIAGYSITPDYLPTVGTEVVAGRGFDSSDGPESARVVLVNEAFVRTQLGGADAVGATLVWHASGEPSELRIVGVVENVVQTSADEGAQPAVYFPYTQTEWPLVQAVIRTTRSPDVVIPELRRALTAFSPLVVPRNVGTMRARMARTRVGPRFQTFVVGVFALVALLIAATGLYGSLAHAVGRRQRELGVRMALGAQRAGVLRMVLRQGMGLALAGVVVGLAGALWGTRLLSGFLYEVEPQDPVTLLTVAALLVLVAAVASFTPARRATTVDPVVVLRAE